MALLLVCLSQCMAQSPGHSNPWTSYRSGRPSRFAGHAFQISPAGGSEYLTATESAGGSVESARCESEPCEPSCQPCCQGLCDECGRRFALTVRPGFFFRSGPRPQLLFSSPAPGSGQTDASQFQFGVASGIEIGGILYTRDNTLDVEFRTSLVDQWSDRIGQAFTGNAVQISGTPPLATTGPRNGITAYRSEYGSWEINARHRWNQSDLTIVTGFRSFRVDEGLSARLVDVAGAVPDEVVQSNVRNRLYGFQVGVDYVVRNCCHWCLRLNGRLGMYGNEGSHSGQLISLAAPPVAFPASGGDSTLAFHAAFGLEARYQFTSCANLVFGYQVQVLDGLALASEQIGNTNFLNQSGYHNNGSIVLNSLTMGVEIVY